SNVMDPAGGASWALSIVGLTLVIRAALIPLFVKQIKSSRNMQLLQPRVKELQNKYKHDRERLAQETMKLYKYTGTNPFARWLPLLMQLSIFLPLFRHRSKAANARPEGIPTQEQATQCGEATLFGRRIADPLLRAAGDVTVMLLAAPLVVAMTTTSFLSQRQLM